MARIRVDLRLDPDLVAWADGFARERRWTRTAVFEAALEALRDAEGGVPEVRVPKPRGVTRAVEAARGAVAPASDPRWERQKRLNAAKERSS